MSVCSIRRNEIADGAYSREKLMPEMACVFDRTMGTVTVSPGAPTVSARVSRVSAAARWLAQNNVITTETYFILGEPVFGLRENSHRSTARYRRPRRRAALWRRGHSRPCGIARGTPLDRLSVRFLGPWG